MEDYETSLGVFSPDGRLIQVENAQNASNQGGTIILQTVSNGILICYENKSINPLILPTSKIQIVDQERGFYMIFSGFKTDSLCVVDEAIQIQCNYKYSTSEDISMEKLASKIAKFKQQFTVDSGMRPLGLRSVLFGIEKGIPKIFVIETDGNFIEYSRCALGFRNEVCNEYLSKSNTEDDAFKALSEVIQMDCTKIRGFILDENGLIEISQQEIERRMK